MIDSTLSKNLPVVEGRATGFEFEEVGGIMVNTQSISINNL